MKTETAARENATASDRRQLLEVVLTKGLSHSETQIVLASGATSYDFVDIKKALAHWDDLILAARIIVEAVETAGYDFNAVGGLTMGADALSVAIASVINGHWFTIRKIAKNRGTGRRIEGYRLSESDKVLVVEDVVTTGQSLREAIGAVRQTGACVSAAASVVDRSDTIHTHVDGSRVTYHPILSCRDLGIPPIIIPPSNES